MVCMAAAAGGGVWCLPMEQAWEWNQGCGQRRSIYRIVAAQADLLSSFT